MASLRRTPNMPNDAAIAKLLYTILKQLDLKSVNWSEVASSLNITNGHAARMRFHRFKQQMEGIQPKPQARKTKSDDPRGKKKQNNVAGDTRELRQSSDEKREEEVAAYVKPEIEMPEDLRAGIQQAMGSSVRVKIEPMGAALQPLAGLPSVLGSEGAHCLEVHGGSSDVAMQHEEQTRTTKPTVKPEPKIKTELG